MSYQSKRRSSIPLLVSIVFLLLLASCAPSVSDREQIANLETIVAGTPSPTSSPIPTTPPTVTPTPTATLGPSPTPTQTPLPSPTLPPPTPTPNPALQGFSFCNQAAGEASGRFSAELTDVKAEGFPAFERLSLGFDVSDGSAPIKATATCVSSSDYLQATGDAEAPGDYVVQVDLANWLQDDAFAASLITQTLTFSETTLLQSATFNYDPNAPAGATVAIGLKEPLPYRLSIERSPLRIIVEVAKASPLVSSSDQLRVPTGGGGVQVPEPVFFLLDGDIWQVENRIRADDPVIQVAGASAKNLTNSAETETDLAVSPDGQTLAFCRAAAGIDPVDTSFAVPSTLWVMDADGQNQRVAASVGINCADPTFSLDGQTLAFSVDETGVAPVQRTIWTVSVSGGTPERVAGDNEWSRFGPQWLADNALVYAAAAEDGRSTLFLRQPNGEEADIGADILVDGTDTPYQGLLRPRASPDGAAIAVEARRSDRPGADLVILNSDGSLSEIVGTDDNDYWTRPLAWGDDGLVYLTTRCASTLVQDYALGRWRGPGKRDLLVAGISLGSLGSATATESGLVYITADQAAPGARGPGDVATRSETTLWFWDIDAGQRGTLLTTLRSATDIVS